MIRVYLFGSKRDMENNLRSYILDIITPAQIIFSYFLPRSITTD